MGCGVLNLYVPEMDRLWGSEKYALQARLAVLFGAAISGPGGRRALSACGDFNIALEDGDIHDPGPSGRGIMGRDAERAGPAARN